MKHRIAIRRLDYSKLPCGTHRHTRYTPRKGIAATRTQDHGIDTKGGAVAQNAAHVFGVPDTYADNGTGRLRVRRENVAKRGIFFPKSTGHDPAMKGKANQILQRIARQDKRGDVANLILPHHVQPVLVD